MTEDERTAHEHDETGGEAPAEPRKAKKPVPKPGARRTPVRAKPDGEKKPMKKADAPAPKTTVKRARKVVKDQGDKKE